MRANLLVLTALSRASLSTMVSSSSACGDIESDKPKRCMCTRVDSGLSERWWDPDSFSFKLSTALIHKPETRDYFDYLEFSPCSDIDLDRSRPHKHVLEQQVFLLIIGQRDCTNMRIAVGCLVSFHNPLGLKFVYILLNLSIAIAALVCARYFFVSRGGDQIHKAFILVLLFILQLSMACVSMLFGDRPLPRCCRSNRTLTALSSLPNESHVQLSKCKSLQ
ncbi:unnamed protein product [Anisakis simplex]|uniref:G protein-coupled receptor n=1 Tax=Anisakis simplex TaxID=6269 RepID=A0A0M3K249_ANISI|nr:unnamed protein product [Anisakis simplex]